MLYSSDTLQELNSFDNHDDCVSSITDDSSQEGCFLSAGWDGCINLWDWRSKSSKTPVSTLRGAHYGHINEVMFQPSSGSTFGSVGSDGFFRLWDKRDFTKGAVGLYSVGQAASCVHWDLGNDQRVFCGTDAGHISTIDLRAISSSTSNSDTIALHRNRVRRIVSHASRGDIVVSVSDDSSLIVANVEAKVDSEEESLPSSFTSFNVLHRSDNSSRIMLFFFLMCVVVVLE